MTMARARGWRVLSTGKGSSRSSDCKNMVDGGGGGNSALMNLIGIESQREGI